jgi:ABC-type glucose/galactose transport system permease subunit
MRVNAGSNSLSGISAYGIVGPQLDWLISQKIFLGDEEFDVSEDTEGFEVSLVAGVGVEITRFIVEFRYIHGLKSISEDFDFGDATDLKSRAYAILFGIRFN